jgi:branched-chain amino acid transport system permease protein
MSVALQLVVSGLALGSIYALLALSLVIINKATDVVNFGQGEMAMIGTFAALAALGALKLPLGLVMLAAFPLGVVFGAVVERVAIRPLATRPPVNSLIATIGLFLLFHHLAGWIWGYDPYRFPSLFSPEPVVLAGARISQASIGILVVSLGVMALLWLFYEKTRLGIAMRAASMNRRAARLMGVNVGRVSMTAWGLATGISLVAGMLVAPLTFLDFEMMVIVLLKAFAGAILGGFNSLPGAVIGCLVIGVVENLFGAYVSTAFKDAFAFGIIVVVLMARPAGLFTRTAGTKV